jgi:hypothetical protein
MREQLSSDKPGLGGGADCLPLDVYGKNMLDWVGGTVELGETMVYQCEWVSPQSKCAAHRH